jgi:hypothetical protein
MRAERTGGGVVRGEGPVRARVLAICAAVLVAVLGAVGWMMLQPGPVPAPPEASRPDAVRSLPKAMAREPEPLPSQPQSQPPAPVAAGREESAEAAGEKETGGESAGDDQEITVDQLPRGDGTGIDAFPRPGTKPLQRGLIVPDGYTLPPGFVRHYQTTDDGVQLAPILKFHPDRLPQGAPADGVVPKELAPPDMPRKWLELPERGRKR